MSTKPNPVAAEALAETAEADAPVLLPFDFEGATYHAIPTIDWTFEALEAFEEGRLVGFLKSVLPADDYARFRATNPRVSKVRDFFEALTAGAGVEGNL